MKAVVTGGAGFIGSALARYLLDHEVEVVNIDKLTYAGNLDSLSQASRRSAYRFEQADIGDRDRVAGILSRHLPDVVIHLAAESHVDRSIDAPDAFLTTNVVGTAHLLQATHAYWRLLQGRRRDNFRFIHVSTDEVFGDLKEAGAASSEETRYAPSSPYAATKAASDHLVRAWGRTYELPVIVTNCSNNYGPFQFPEKLIPHMILNALSGKPLPIYGDGQQIRDWLFVDDHVRALWAIAERGEPGETYNIGGSNERRNIDVVRSICKVLQETVTPSPTRPFDELITFVRDRPGHDTRYAIDARKIADKLGWKPEETFETGLEKTVHWYLENRWWWQRVLDGTYRLERIGTSMTR